jgi:hypothetical protein
MSRSPYHPKPVVQNQKAKRATTPLLRAAAPLNYNPLQGLVSQCLHSFLAFLVSLGILFTIHVPTTGDTIVSKA